MGMFDSLYDAEGREWQTKAYARILDQVEIGEVMPDPEDAPAFDSYQVEVLGGVYGEYVWSLATIRDHMLVAVPDERIEDLPLVGYSSGFTPAAVPGGESNEQA